MANAASWFTSKDEGWYFYRGKPLPPKEEAQEDHPVEAVPVPSPAPQQRKTDAEMVKEFGEKLLGQAMVNPTEDNVKTYMLYQKRMMDGANQFAQVWERVLAKNPDLYLATHYSEDVTANMQKGIEDLARRAGIFFFFSSTCPHCHRQAPAILELKQKYGFQVIAVSMDGGDMPILRGMVAPDNGISANLGIGTVPAIYLAYPGEDRFEAISQGYLPYNDIERRIYHYAEIKKGVNPNNMLDLINRVGAN